MTGEEAALSEEMILHYTSRAQLYSAYMGFIKHGGLFIPTHKSYPIYHKFLLKLQFMDEPEIYEVEGTVIWITPLGAQEGMPAGVGVQLIGEHAKKVIAKIESYLAEMLSSGERTDTM